MQGGKRLISGFPEVAVQGGFGVFRGNSAGITAGVIFHPLGAGRGSAIPQVLQPCQFQQSPDGDMREDLCQQKRNPKENTGQQSAAQS